MCVEVPHGSDGTANFIMQGGSITGCEAVSGGHNGSPSGGGVCVKNGATFTMTGGSITGCTAESSDSGPGGSPSFNGGGVYVKDDTATFTMKDSAVITPSSGENTDSKKFNDVYLSSGAKITVDGILSPSGDKAARITVPYGSYSESTKVLDSSPISQNYKKFEVTPKGSTPWYVGSNGHLTTTPPQP